jgi:hypothetical protein
MTFHFPQTWPHLSTAENIIIFTYSIHEFSYAIGGYVPMFSLLLCLALDGYASNMLYWATEQTILIRFGHGNGCIVSS